MITDKQKKIFSIASFIAILLGLLAVLPLDIILARTDFEIKNVEIIELIIKLIVIPIVSIAMSLYFMKMRHNILKEQKELSAAVIKMCYLPVAIYISGLLGWIGGVVYASISFAENMVALLCIIISWCASALVIILFGVYTEWLNNQTKKGFTIFNIVYLVFSIIIVIGIYLGYKKITPVEKLTELNAFVQLAVYLIAYFAMLLFLWKAIYSEQSVSLLEKNDEYSKEEKEEIITRIIEDEVLSEFDLYYEKNIGKNYEELKKYQGIKKTDEDVEANLEDEKVVEEQTEINEDEKVEGEIQNEE